MLIAYLLALLAVVSSEKPCSLYDVTTLRRKDDSLFRYEVHSRSDAVGLMTNFKDITGGDPLQDSKLTCYFNKTQPCSGWELSGFELSQWRGNDLFLEWIRLSKPDYDSYNVGDGDTNLNPHLRVYRRYLLSQQSDVLQFRIRLANYTKFIIIGTIDSSNLSGLEFVFNTSTTLLYQEKRMSGYRDYYRFIMRSIGNGNKRGTIEFGKQGDIFSVFLRRKNNQVCFWIENEYSARDCLFNESMNDEYVSFITYENHPQPDFDVFRTSDFAAMQLAGTSGSASVTSFSARRPSGKLCISLRYFLKKDEMMKISFIAETAPQKIVYSKTIQGTGKVASKQFSMIVPESHDQGPLQITFETQSATSFILRSARECSAKDRDVIVMRGASVCSTPYCRNVFNRSGTLKEVGFGLHCLDDTESILQGNQCYHGGTNVNGGCLCSPGFIGSSCEKACPPGRFGGDCGGTCVGSPDCEGVYMAAPRQRFECSRGFTGPDCSEVCQAGFYGPDCRLKCGECLHGTCNRFSGLCDGPCKQGFKNRTCQYQLASVDSVNILSSTFTSAEGSVEITKLSDEEMKLYPFVKVSYAKVLEKFNPLARSSKFLALTSRNVKFHLDNLDHGEGYYVWAVLIHESGDYYEAPFPDAPYAVVSTSCNVCSFDKVDVLSEETILRVAWKVSESEKYPCEILGYQLEIYLPETADNEPLIRYFSRHETNTTVEAVFPREGSFRLGADMTATPTFWTYHEFSNSANIEVSRNFQIVGKSTRSIDFSWSTTENLHEDLLVCTPEPVLCDRRELANKTQRVEKGQFTVKGLFPFTKYTCLLEKSQIEATTMTQQDLPTGPPKQHDQPTYVTNTTAHIQWKNADCLDINGIQKGFRIELWRGNSMEDATTTTDSILEKTFEDIFPETSYEARIYVLNELGWNVASVLSIPFKTKSTTPNAVSNLLVYKRTRSDLWIRWTPPENDSTETVVVAYKVTASAPGVESQTLEFAPTQCSTWPEYSCHRLRSLAPDTEYTIEVQAKNDKVDLYGSPTRTKGMTKEGVPDAPVDVRIHNRTAESVVLTWEVPLLLNSNPKFFVTTLEQTDENDSHENPTESVEQKIPITEGQRIYEAKFDRLNSATTYVATISAGLRGSRSMLTVNTPPRDPPSPPAPTVDETSGSKRIIFHGIKSKPDFPKLLSGYLLLVAADNTVNLNHGISDPDLAASIQSQLGDNFYVANEFGPSLTDEVFNFETESARPGNFSSIQNMRLEPGHEYRFALAAISTYCGANAVAVSPVLTFKN